MKANGRLISLLSTFAIAGTAHATLVDFTGGTATLRGGPGPGGTFTTTPGVDDTTPNVLHYDEGGIRFAFIGPDDPDQFSYLIGDYYEPGNDVIHGHWAPNGFNDIVPGVTHGLMTSILVTQPDPGGPPGALIPFDLNYFKITTNTEVGGGSATGAEEVYVNALAADLTTVIDSILLPSDDWGFAGPNSEVYLPATFDGIFGFSFTNAAGSTAVGFGLDEFFIDEPPPPGQGVPEPGEILLAISGLLGLVIARRRMAKPAAAEADAA